MDEKRESGRVKELQQKRVLDEAARRRRQRKALEALEQDNFQEDPHGDLKMSKKAPKFEESVGTALPSSGKKKKKVRSDHFKYRFKKSFAALIEEEHMLNKDPPNYFSSCAPPSKLPERHFCAICGSIKLYMCPVWSAVLLYSMSGHPSRHKVFKVDSMREKVTVDTKCPVTTGDGGSISGTAYVIVEILVAWLVGRN